MQPTIIHYLQELLISPENPNEILLAKIIAIENNPILYKLATELKIHIPEDFSLEKIKAVLQNFIEISNDIAFQFFLYDKGLEYFFNREIFYTRYTEIVLAHIQQLNEISSETLQYIFINGLFSCLFDVNFYPIVSDEKFKKHLAQYLRDQNEILAIKLYTPPVLFETKMLRIIRQAEHSSVDDMHEITILAAEPRMNEQSAKFKILLAWLNEQVFLTPANKARLMLLFRSPDGTNTLIIKAKAMPFFPELGAVIHKAEKIDIMPMIMEKDAEEDNYLARVPLFDVILKLFKLLHSQQLLDQEIYQLITLPFNLESPHLGKDFSLKDLMRIKSDLEWGKLYNNFTLIAKIIEILYSDSLLTKNFVRLLICIKDKINSNLLNIISQIQYYIDSPKKIIEKICNSLSALGNFNKLYHPLREELLIFILEILDKNVYISQYSSIESLKEQDTFTNWLIQSNISMNTLNKKEFFDHYYEIVRLMRSVYVKHAYGNQALGVEDKKNITTILNLLLTKKIHSYIFPIFYFTRWNRISDLSILKRMTQCIAQQSFLRNALDAGIALDTLFPYTSSRRMDPSFFYNKNFFSPENAPYESLICLGEIVYIDFLSSYSLHPYFAMVFFAQLSKKILDNMSFNFLSQAIFWNEFLSILVACNFPPELVNEEKIIQLQLGTELINSLIFFRGLSPRDKNYANFEFLLLNKNRRNISEYCLSIIKYCKEPAVSPFQMLKCLSASKFGLKNTYYFLRRFSSISSIFEKIELCKHHKQLAIVLLYFFSGHKFPLSICLEELVEKLNPFILPWKESLLSKKELELNFLDLNNHVYDIDHHFFSFLYNDLKVGELKLGLYDSYFFLQLHICLRRELIFLERYYQDVLISKELRQARPDLLSSIRQDILHLFHTWQVIRAATPYQYRDFYAPLGFIKKFIDFLLKTGYLSAAFKLYKQYLPGFPSLHDDLALSLIALLKTDKLEESATDEENEVSDSISETHEQSDNDFIGQFEYFKLLLTLANKAQEEQNKNRILSNALLYFLHYYHPSLYSQYKEDQPKLETLKMILPIIPGTQELDYNRLANVTNPIDFCNFLANELALDPSKFQEMREEYVHFSLEKTLSKIIHLLFLNESESPGEHLSQVCQLVKDNKLILDDSYVDEGNNQQLEEERPSQDLETLINHVIDKFSHFRNSQLTSEKDLNFRKFEMLSHSLSKRHNDIFQKAFSTKFEPDISKNPGLAALLEEQRKLISHPVPQSSRPFLFFSGMASSSQESASPEQRQIADFVFSI